MLHPRIKRDERHSIFDRRSQQPGIGDLSMPQKTARASAQHIRKAEVQRHKPMFVMRRIAQEEFSDVRYGDGSA